MPIMDDGIGPYTLGQNGEKRYATATEFRMNDEVIYQFSPETGVLQISADEQTIKQLTDAVGGLPVAELVLPSPPPLRQECHFHGVKEIKSLSRKDGSFFLTITSPEQREEEEYRAQAKYAGKKTACDNCGRVFKAGEVISSDERQQLAFCYSDTGGGCAPAYTFSSGKMVCGVPVRFGEELISSRERTPNYPNTPVVPLKQGTPQKKWWQKLFGS